MYIFFASELFVIYFHNFFSAEESKSGVKIVNFWNFKITFMDHFSNFGSSMSYTSSWIWQIQKCVPQIRILGCKIPREQVIKKIQLLVWVVKIDRGWLSHILFENFCIFCVQYLTKLWYAKISSEPLATIEQYRISFNHNTMVVNEQFIREVQLWQLVLLAKGSRPPSLRYLYCWLTHVTLYKTSYFLYFFAGKN